MLYICGMWLQECGKNPSGSKILFSTWGFGLGGFFRFVFGVSFFSFLSRVRVFFLKFPWLLRIDITVPLIFLFMCSSKLKVPI